MLVNNYITIVIQCIITLCRTFIAIYFCNTNGAIKRDSKFAERGTRSPEVTTDSRGGSTVDSRRRREPSSNRLIDGDGTGVRSAASVKL